MEKRGDHMSSNNEKIRKSLEEILEKLNSESNSSRQKSTTLRESNLYSYFSELLIARDESLSNFDNLLNERLTLYLSVISLMYINKINNNLQSSNVLINFLFQLGKIISNEDFVKSISRVFYYSNSENIGIDNTILSSYFFNIYESIRGLLYDEIEITFSTSDVMTINTAVVKTINFDNLDEQEYQDKILFLVRYISELGAKTSVQQIRLFASKINKYSEFLSGDGEGSLIKELGENISDYLLEIDKSILTIKFINEFMKEKDSNYKDTYIVEIIGLFDSLSEILERLSEVTVKNINILENTGDITKFTSTMLDIDGKSRDTLNNVFEAIKILEAFLEDYTPFITIPSNQSSSLMRTIELIESLDYSSQNFIYDPFEDFLISGKEYKISEWIRAVINTKIIDGDIFNLIIMLAGTVLYREELSEEIGSELKSYSFLNFLRKNLIFEEYLKTAYKEKRDMERDLVKVDKLVVSEDFNNQKIPFVYKNSLPKLEVLDYIDFTNIKYFSSSPPANEPELKFRENIRILILESFSREKLQLAGTVKKIINYINSGKGQTLKSLYMELCFREVIELFLDYIDSNESAIIDPLTKEIMIKFSNTDDKNNLISRITKYLSVWNYFYNQEYDLIENALVDGDLKNLFN
jgi:hypothetical protein